MANKPNRYRSTCISCGSTVESGQGIIEKSGGKWLTYHKDGKCIKRDLSFSHIYPDKYQTRILESICDGKDAPHLICMARAGSGKTTVLCKGVTNLYQRTPLRILCLAFGNEDGIRMRERLPQEVMARTTHSWAMEIIKEHFPGAKFEKGKYYNLLQTMLGDGNDTSVLRGMVNETIDKVQADAVLYEDVTRIEATIKEYGIPVGAANVKQVAELASKVLLVGKNYQQFGYDFNDCLHAVATQDIPLPKYDVVTWDESQDLNMAQLLLLDKFIDAGSRIVVVLDDKQTIYLFRGSRAKCTETIREKLNKSERGVVELPMPVSRRNAKAIVALAQKYVPDIQALPDAPEGIVKTDLPMEEMVSRWTPGEDMVLCRNNKPLIALKYYCLKNNVPAYFRGGAKEAGFLNWLIDMFANKLGTATDNIGTLLERAGSYLQHLAEANSRRLAEYQDRIEIIQTVSERVITVKQLKTEIRKLFAAPPTVGKHIVLSTIHLAKGSESQRVFLIYPELIGRAKSRAKSDEAKAQEDNAAYIAVTRAKLEYYEITGELPKAA